MLSSLLFFLNAYTTTDDRIRPLPRPTGKYAVGCRLGPVEASPASGTHRQVRTWYPSRGEGRTQPYLSPSLQAEIARQKLLNLAPEILDAWKELRLSASAESAVARGKFPLVVYMPGAGMPMSLYSGYCQELASRGFIVAAVDFSNGGFLVGESGQVDESMTGEGEEPYIKQSNDWAHQVSEIVDELVGGADPGGWAASIDLSKVVAIGHSQGGAAAIEAARVDKRIRACIDFDGVPLGYAFEHGIQPSTLFVRSRMDLSDAELAAKHQTRAKREAMGSQIVHDLQRWFGVQGGPSWVVSVQGTNHISFSDAPFTFPTEISRWGGKPLAPGRFFRVTSDLAEDFIRYAVGERKRFTVRAPELAIQVCRR